MSLTELVMFARFHKMASEKAVNILLTSIKEDRELTENEVQDIKLLSITVRALYKKLTNK